MQELRVDNYIIDTPIYDILVQLKSELTNGKLKSIQKRGTDIRVTCPHHDNGLEKTGSCDIYCGDDEKIGYGVSHCFACDFKGPFWHFVAECFDKSDEYGKEWLKSRFGKESYLTTTKIDLPEITLNKKKQTKFLNEDVLNNFQDWHPYMSKRRLTKEICKQFQVKYDSDTKCLVFPVRDERGRLVMLTRRSVLNKMFLIDKDVEKPVYLYDYIRKNNIEEVTICESQINALTLWSYHIPAVALFGTGTQHQYDILNKSSIKHYYICLDGDEAGYKGTIKFLKNIRDDVFVDVIILPSNKDVNDLSEDEFNNLKILSSQDWYEQYVK